MRGYGTPWTAIADRLLTVPETADRLAVSRATVYRLIDDRQLVPIRVRSHVRVAESDVTALIDRRRVEATSS